MTPLWLILASFAWPQGKPENVLIVANTRSPVSRSIAEYYARQRQIPSRNVCYVDTVAEESVSREVYDRQIATPVAQCLRSRGLTESVLYVVTTLGVPLRILATDKAPATAAAVDSELTLLYSDLKRLPHPLDGPYVNPFYRERQAAFSHPKFPIYLVTRLAAYDFSQVRRMIDQSLKAVNRGKVVLDMRSGWEQSGDEWLKTAALRLPADRVVLDESSTVLTAQRDVIGYGSWGSNDKNRKQRFLGFQWLPGAIVTDYVSGNGRSFESPPESWTISTWTDADRPKWWKGSPQSLSADYLREGATGASGHVDEPKLGFTPRPEFLFPAYLSGRNLAESYYMSIPALSWMNIVLGDPLCRLAPPR